MKLESRHSQPLPAEWTGAHLFIEKWLGHRAVVDSFFQFIGGAIMFIAGLVALVLTSGFTAAVILFLVFEISLVFGAAGINISALRPLLFAILVVFFMGVAVYYAWVTRRESGPPRVNFDSSISSLASITLEFISAGPIFMVLAAQDFYKCARLSRMDVPQVSAILLWLYDRNHRASFAEISLAFPGLNAVRVLPQLRDLSGVYWWPQEGEIALSEELQETLADVIGRDPKNFPGFSRPAEEPHRAERPAPGVSAEMLAWYTTLKLPPFATLQQVKARYRKLAKVYHPDARARSSTGAADDEQMKRINEAYHNILKQSQNQPGTFI